MGQVIEFESEGQTSQAYLAEAPSGKGPGVIVLQEWWGLVDHIKKVCDRFAEAGYTALAPDLFEGKATKEPSEAERMFMQLNVDQTESKLRGCIAHLLSLESCSTKQVSVIGFCMGGQLALYAASKNPKQISAVADFYGVHPNIKPDIKNIEAPILGIFAEKDQFVTPEAVDELESKLQAEGKSFEFTTFMGVDHAFFNDDRKDVYAPEAAAEAWQKTLAHFEDHRG